MVTGSLLIATDGSGNAPVLNAYDKKTGTKVGSVKLPASGQYGMMTYMHEGRQYVVVQIGGAQYPGSLVALALPPAQK
jgi:quinoprotein glucose dehydrogenase